MTYTIAHFPRYGKGTGCSGILTYMPGEREQSSFSLLIKPAGADCNLRCAYCFYLPKGALYPRGSRHRMSDRVLQRLIATYMATAQPTYSFGWQGGEPTLMGVEFFRRVVRLQQACGRPGSVVANGLQTNGLLIDDELASLFAEYRFLLGVSLDGPEALHDLYRRTARGAGTYRRVLRGIELLRRHQVEFNVLVAVNAANVGRPRELYRFLVDNGVLYHQYIPILELDRRGDPLPFSVDPRGWGEFLCALYEQWYPDAGRVSIRLFDALLSHLVDGVPAICTMGKDCRQYLLVEHNGDVYPCDFFVQPDLLLGNIMEREWPELLRSELYREFGARKSRWNDLCSACPYLELCAGDCPKHRFGEAGDPSALSRLCAGWRLFFEATLPGFRRLARRIQRRRSRELEVRMLAPAGRAGGRR
jgi:uncharacterized protein